MFQSLTRLLAFHLTISSVAAGLVMARYTGIQSVLGLGAADIQVVLSQIHNINTSSFVVPGSRIEVGSQL